LLEIGRRQRDAAPLEHVVKPLLQIGVDGGLLSADGADRLARQVVGRGTQPAGRDDQGSGREGGPKRVFDGAASIR
jgi:hypothetical protein